MKNRKLISDLSVSPDTPLEEVLKVMTGVGQKIVCVVDSDQRLLGIVTDYDFRIAILEHKPMDTAVKEFMNAKPMVVSAEASERAIFECMHETGFDIVPAIDAARRVIALHYIDEFASFKDADGSGSVAVVMAGGVGERLRPMTNETPKPMLRVGGKPILFTLLDQILTEGFETIYVSVNYKSEVVVNAISDIARYRNRIQFVFETERMGTAGSLSLLPARPQGAFAVINGDLLTSVSLQEMVSFHNRDSNHITVALKKEEYRVPYGVAELDGTRITGLREKPAYSFFVNTGAYVLEPSAIDRLEPGEPCDMTDLIDRAIDAGDRVGSFPIHEYWLDIGTPEQFKRAQRDYDDNFAD